MILPSIQLQPLYLYVWICSLIVFVFLLLDLVLFLGEALVVPQLLWQASVEVLELVSAVLPQLVLVCFEHELKALQNQKGRFVLQRRLGAHYLSVVYWCKGFAIFDDFFHVVGLLVISSPRLCIVYIVLIVKRGGGIKLKILMSASLDLLTRLQCHKDK